MHVHGHIAMNEILVDCLPNGNAGHQTEYLSWSPSGAQPHCLDEWTSSRRSAMLA